MEHRKRREPLGLSDLLLVYHDFLLALSRRTERLIQDFNAFIQCFNGRRMAAGCHKWADSKICLCMADKKPAVAGLFVLINVVAFILQPLNYIAYFQL